MKKPPREATRKGNRNTFILSYYTKFVKWEVFQMEENELYMEENELGNVIIYRLFDEFLDELASQTEAEKKENQEALAHFAKLNGVSEKSTYALIFWGFRGGVGKGIDLSERLVEIQEKSDAAEG